MKEDDHTFKFIRNIFGFYSLPVSWFIYKIIVLIYSLIWLFTFLSDSHYLHFTSYSSSTSSLTNALFNCLPNYFNFYIFSVLSFMSCCFSFRIGASLAIFLMFYYFKMPMLFLRI